MCYIYAVLCQFNHSLKKSPIETKRVGNRRKVYNYKKSFVALLTSLC